MQHSNVGRIIKTTAFPQNAVFDQYVFDRLHSVFCQMDLLAFFVDRIVALTFFFGLAGEFRNNLIERCIKLAVTVSRPGNNQWRSSFIDQDGIDLINNREIQTSLDPLLGQVRHVVTQVVKAEFIVSAVGDITGIGGSTLFV